MKIRSIFWVAMALAGLAGAGPITFTISTTGAGTLGALTFTDATITFTQVSDTSLIGSCFGTDLCPPASTANTVTVQGLGTFTITDSTLFFDNPGGSVGVDDTNTFIDAISEHDAAFVSYNMQTALGPIFDSVSSPTYTGMGTSGGAFSYTGNSLDATFTAVTAVPEPGSLGLVLGGAMLGLCLRFSRGRSVCSPSAAP
jgi:hypothetical protein